MITGLCVVMAAERLSESRSTGELVAESLILRHPDSEPGDVVTMTPSALGGLEIQFGSEPGNAATLTFGPDSGGYSMTFATEQGVTLKTRLTRGDARMVLRAGGGFTTAELEAGERAARLTFFGANPEQWAVGERPSSIGVDGDSGFVLLGSRRETRGGGIEWDELLFVDRERSTGPWAK